MINKISLQHDNSKQGMGLPHDKMKTIWITPSLIHEKYGNDLDNKAHSSKVNYTILSWSCPILKLKLSHLIQKNGIIDQMIFGANKKPVANMGCRIRVKKIELAIDHILTIEPWRPCIKPVKQKAWKQNCTCYYSWVINSLAMKINEPVYTHPLDNDNWRKLDSMSWIRIL